MNTLKAVPSGSEAIKFIKMHGLGNDYVYLMLEENPRLMRASEQELSALARAISERHTGIGGDGMVMIAPCEEADICMRIWNADGSEAQMCGNASRCVGKIVFDSGLITKKDFTLSTRAGIRKIYITTDAAGKAASIRVDMGEPVLEPALVPVRADEGSNPAAVTIPTELGSLLFTAVSMGNPHGVCFVDEITDELVLGVGPQIERHEAWPEKTNVEFARVIDRGNVQMRVWERGSGETMACGTGSCATAVAAMLRGLTDREVNIHLPGGILNIIWDEASNHVFMSGPAVIVAEGTYFYQP